MALVDDIRTACVGVVGRASHVTVEADAIPAYAAELPFAEEPALDPELHLLEGSREDRAAFFLCLDAINFGSGWFPTLRKDEGASGYETVARALRSRFVAGGAPAPEELAWIGTAEVADLTKQDPAHELVGLWTEHLRDLARKVGSRSWTDVVDAAGGSAVALVEELAWWPGWWDASDHEGENVPFFKRAQIVAADLHLGGVADFADLHRLTMFADNVVPHVLRVDGVLRYEPELAARIDREEPLAHGSPEEVEIRACAVHAVELIAAAHGATTAQRTDHVLWNRGRAPRYKAVPRHRARCTAY